MSQPLSRGPRQGLKLAFLHELKPEAHLGGPAYEDGFGWSVALDGDVLAVGARFRNEAFVYRWNGSEWIEEANLVHEDAAPSDQLGMSIDVQGDRIAVGAIGDSEGSAVSCGAVYVFEPMGGVWEQTQRLIASDPVREGVLGLDVALEGDRLVAGKYRAAYVFAWDGVQWTETRKLLPQAPVLYDRFGRSVAASGDDILVGAPGFGSDESGYASMFRPSAAANYGAGWPGTLGVPDLTTDADPVPGTTLDITIENSLGEDTLATMLVGIEKTETVTALEGTLLVLPTWVVPVHLPAAGLVASLVLPSQGAPDLYLQGLQSDPGASQGVSFTPGLALYIECY